MGLYKHYSEIKQQYPDTLVLYRVGDFYELYGDDAVTASKELDLTLTSRDFGLAERAPMCGVPYHNMDMYLAKLIEKGYKAAVCESATAMPVTVTDDKPKEKAPRLKLKAEGAAQETILNYLERNASDVLAGKINNGVKIVKDGKTLISKKDLTGFMTYACNEARKQAAKGARAACVKSDTVFGWAIHYFEESAIEGTLYNEDGSEYKQIEPAVKKGTNTSYTPAPPKPKAPTLFDMLEEPKVEAVAEAIDADDDDCDETDEEVCGDEDTCEQNDVCCDASETADDTPSLVQLDETHYADTDGVVHVIEQPKNTNLDALREILGDVFITR